jgi:pimeloyl-ACP methyl ester carboxylesterase
MFAGLMNRSVMRFSSLRSNLSGDPDAGWKAVDWSVHTRQATVRGRRINYADIGSGPVAVLVHGQGGSWQWWLRVLPTVSAHRRVIAVDLPGFGGSDPIATGDVFGEHVATIIGLLDHLGLPDATVAGHSMGGLVALQVACDHPDRVAGLMLIDAGGANIGARRLALIVTGLRAFSRIFAIPWVPRFVARARYLRSALMALAMHDPGTLSTSLAMEILPRMAAPGFAQSLHAAAIAVNKVTPEAVTCPSLILWGFHDRILPVSTGHVLASKIPDARFVPLENVGHCVMVEAPDQFSRLLIDFTRHP